MKTTEERFWTKVKKSDDCWEWMASRDSQGYGTFYLDKRVVKAHRLSWEMKNGPIPQGLLVCHTCDSPWCVNPSHLFLGDHSINATDLFEKHGSDHLIGLARRPRGLLVHGKASTYQNRACRCELCRAAQSQYMAKWRKSKKDARH